MAQSKVYLDPVIIRHKYVEFDKKFLNNRVNFNIVRALINTIKLNAYTRADLMNDEVAKKTLKNSYLKQEDPPEVVLDSFKKFWIQDEDIHVFCNETWRIIDYLCIFLYILCIQEDVTKNKDMISLIGGSGSVHYWKIWTTLFGIKWFKRSSKDLRADDNQAVFRNFFRGSTDTVASICTFISSEYKNINELYKTEVKERVMKNFVSVSRSHHV